ncbi:signaling peptide TAXIMIN 2-like [Hevea brasiliensis]|uniref:signaling peptide TAXIMIN 2-like n=1 Tax=Hevea brasiliensis TaxID=3981 RepID=UPI0025E0C984|nr:signaling peptide TAXIMIN 2-like [Hevea brasiliensis]
MADGVLGLGPILVILLKLHERRKIRKSLQEIGDCRPYGFLLGLPFALVALLLSLIGAVAWIIGTILSCLCPCCVCCAGLANLAIDIIKLPFKILKWFADIPC